METKRHLDTHVTALRVIAVIAVGVMLFFVAFGARNDDYLSDPRFTLVTAQALLDHGTVALDAYQQEGIQGFDYDWYLSRGEMLHINGHYYDYFPVGPGVLSVPAVWVARAFGMDMRTADNAVVQRVLSAASVSCAFLLLYLLARSQLDALPSMAVAIVFTAGSSILSTMGSALWSINFTTVITATLLCLLAYRNSETLPFSIRTIIGLLLFLAYFTRASASAFILAILIYIFVKQRTAFPVVAATAGSLLVAFSLWSQSTYGLWLPPYYLPSRLSTGALAPIHIGLMGHLVSPSRGVLVFSPFLLILLLALIIQPSLAMRDPLARACGLWVTMLLLVSAQGVQWWGGWSFGPRLLTEIIPGLMFMTASAWRRIGPVLSAPARSVTIVSFLSLGSLAIVVHGPQGLYNPSIRTWNASVYPIPPTSSDRLGDLFDWRYSQALASDAVNCRMEHDHGSFLLPLDQTLGEYAWGTPITYASDMEADWRSIARSTPKRVSPSPSVAPIGDLRLFLPFVPNRALLDNPTNVALFIGFQNLDRSHRDVLSTRWTLCSKSLVIIGPMKDVQYYDEVVLDLAVRALEPQTLRVSVNGTSVGERIIDGRQDRPEPVMLSFAVPAHLFHDTERNIVTLELPSAPDDNWIGDLLDPGVPYGIELHEMTLRPLSALDADKERAASVQREPAQ